MLARLQVLPLVARRFFFDHTSQGKWLHELHGWSSLILKKLLQRTFLKVTWVTEGLFEECPWHDWLLFLSRPKSRVCKSLHSEIQSYKEVISVISFWRMPGQPTFFWATFSPKSATVALKKENLVVRVLQVLSHVFKRPSVGEHKRFPIRGLFSLGPELGHTAIEGNHPDNATSESLRVVFSPNI